MFDEIVYPFITNHLQGTTPQLVLHDQIIFGHHDVHNAPSLPHSTEATTISIPLRMDDGPPSDAACSIQSAHHIHVDQSDPSQPLPWQPNQTHLDSVSQLQESSERGH